MKRAYYESIKNPNPIPDDGFDHYEIQTVRLIQEPGDDEPTWMVIHEDADADFSDTCSIGPILYGIYGHVAGQGVEHIADRDTLEQALDTLRKMGCACECT
jgi:hypothetical protein